MAANGAGRCFFLLIQSLPTFWATRILILRICIFWIFVGSQISRFLDLESGSCCYPPLVGICVLLKKLPKGNCACLTQGTWLRHGFSCSCDKLPEYTHPHQGWIAARAAYWPIKENTQEISILGICSAHGRQLSKRKPKRITGMFFSLLIRSLPIFWA